MNLSYQPCPSLGLYLYREDVAPQAGVTSSRSWHSPSLWDFLESHFLGEQVTLVKQTAGDP